MGLACTPGTPSLSHHCHPLEPPAAPPHLTPLQTGQCCSGPGRPIQPRSPGSPAGLRYFRCCWAQYNPGECPLLRPLGQLFALSCPVAPGSSGWEVDAGSMSGPALDAPHPLVFLLVSSNTFTFYMPTILPTAPAPVMDPGGLVPHQAVGSSFLSEA